MTPEAARAALHLPDRALVEALAREPAAPGAHPRVELGGGYLRLASGDDQADAPADLATPEEPWKPPEPRESTVQSREPQPSLPAHVLAGVRAVLADLAREPFLAPEAGRLRELGLDSRAIAAAARAGLLLRVTEQIVLAPDAETSGGASPRGAAPALHGHRGQAGPGDDPARSDPAARAPGPGRGHPAPSRRPAPPALNCSPSRRI